MYRRKFLPLVSESKYVGRRIDLVAKEMVSQIPYTTIFDIEEGGFIFLRNFVIYQQDYMVSQFTRSQSKRSPPSNQNLKSHTVLSGSLSSWHDANQLQMRMLNKQSLTAFGLWVHCGVTTLIVRKACCEIIHRTWGLLLM
jgi:hypothetical protein